MYKIHIVDRNLHLTRLRFEITVIRGERTPYRVRQFATDSKTARQKARLIGCGIYAVTGKLPSVVEEKE